jgi:hypothetical protein
MDYLAFTAITIYCYLYAKYTFLKLMRVSIDVIIRATTKQLN